LSALPDKPSYTQITVNGAQLNFQKRGENIACIERRLPASAYESGSYTLYTRMKDPGTADPIDKRDSEALITWWQEHRRIGKRGSSYGTLSELLQSCGSKDIQSACEIADRFRLPEMPSTIRKGVFRMAQAHGYTAWLYRSSLQEENVMGIIRAPKDERYHLLYEYDPSGNIFSDSMNDEKLVMNTIRVLRKSHATAESLRDMMTKYPEIESEIGDMALLGDIPNSAGEYTPKASTLLNAGAFLYALEMKPDLCQVDYVTAISQKHIYALTDTAGEVAGFYKTPQEVAEHLSKTLSDRANTRQRDAAEISTVLELTLRSDGRITAQKEIFPEDIIKERTQISEREDSKKAENTSPDGERNAKSRAAKPKVR